MSKKVVVGTILSESSFFTVTEVKSNGDVLVKDDMGNTGIHINKKYLESIIDVADSFEKEEKLTKTDLGELFIKSSKIAMTVAFFKKDEVKTKKVFEAEKAAKISEIENAKVSDVARLLNDLMENPLTKVIPGELRVMKGRHYGKVELSTGRVNFLDMELERDRTKSEDNRFRQVDPRTIQYIIVDGVKYSLK